MDILNNKEIQDTFKKEASELLEQMIKGLSILKSAPKAAVKKPVIRDIFRSAHTLRCISGMLGYAKIEEIAKPITEAFRLAIEGNRKIDAEFIALIFEGVNVCGLLLQGEKVPCYNQLLKSLKGTVSK